jgi:hypothetical protein
MGMDQMRNMELYLLLVSPSKLPKCVTMHRNTLKADTMLYFVSSTAYYRIFSSQINRKCVSLVKGFPCASLIKHHAMKMYGRVEV